MLFCSKHVAATAKHYVGDGGTVNGINENNTVIDWHGLLKTHMPPYFAGIVKGVSSIMVSYSSFNGMKMHVNKKLVTDYLKKILKFRVIIQLITVLSHVVNKFATVFFFFTPFNAI